jgi:hypothetical protein
MLVKNIVTPKAAAKQDLFSTNRVMRKVFYHCATTVLAMELTNLEWIQ